MSGRKVSRRWPVQPLAELVGGRGELGRIVDSGNLTRAWRDGLTDRSADAWAVRCGFHPSEVWPEIMDAAIEDASKPCADPKCDQTFVPSTRARAGKHRFCSKRCADRVNAERQRQRPEVAAANRERRRAYYAAYGEYERARERRKYRERQQRPA